jgi:hypothetical protein
MKTQEINYNLSFTSFSDLDRLDKSRQLMSNIDSCSLVADMRSLILRYTEVWEQVVCG